MASNQRNANFFVLYTTPDVVRRRIQQLVSEAGIDIFVKYTLERRTICNTKICEMAKGRAINRVMRDLATFTKKKQLKYLKLLKVALDSDDDEVDDEDDDDVILVEDEKKEPDVKEPNVKEPHLKEPGVKEPHLKEPDVNEPDVKEPHLKEPDVNEPDVKEPDLIVIDDDDEPALIPVEDKGKQAAILIDFKDKLLDSPFWKGLEEEIIFCMYAKLCVKCKTALSPDKHAYDYCFKCIFEELTEP